MKDDSPPDGSIVVRSRMNDGTEVGGHVLYSGWDPSPADLRRRAARLSYQGLSGLNSDRQAAESALREAIELMVDAFLLDRRGNLDIFRRAHELGALVEREFGCRWVHDRASRTSCNPCGVLALHSRIGLSPGMRTWTECMTCGAADFQCDHLGPRRVTRFEAGEVSFTPRPKDPRCFRTWIYVGDSKATNRPPIGETAIDCTHCARCHGRGGAMEEDLDPASWNVDVDEFVDALKVRFEHGPSTHPG
jgi:hypothetical protein